ncbi:hypothetical protein HAX54_019518, partial [Datura stramonium]|nr:hypothetical protein [Datura stramonium]
MGTGPVGHYFLHEFLSGTVDSAKQGGIGVTPVRKKETYYTSFKEKWTITVEARFEINSFKDFQRDLVSTPWLSGHDALLRIRASMGWDRYHPKDIYSIYWTNR